MTSRQALFVSGIDGFCHRYAVLHRASHLRACGWEVTVLPYRHPDLERAAARAEILLFYRVPANRQVMRVLDRAIETGIGRIGLVDDLIFRTGEAFVPPFVARREERDLWQDGAARYECVLASCDEVLASSLELVAEVESLGIESHLYRDAMSAEELDLGRKAQDAAGARPLRQEFRVGYFSGTATHGADFGRAARGLAAAMEENPLISLHVRGPLEMPPELARFAARISQGALVPWVELPAAIAATDLNLAPLEIQSRFASAKGATKVMEAAACGVPSIASPTSSHRAAMVAGGGWLAESEEEWREALLAAAAAKPRLASMGDRARRHIVEAYGAASRVPEMENLLSRVESRGRTASLLEGDASPRVAAVPDEPLWAGALAPDAFPVLAERLQIDTSPPLGEGDVLRQEFCLTVPGLFRLDLFTLTYGQQFDHAIGVRLLGAAGQVLAGKSWDAGRLPDHGFFSWDLERPLPAGSFVVELESRGTGPGNAASFGLVEAGPDRSLATFNGQAIAGALGLRGFSFWDQVL